ncbi:hypothetical protein QVD17_16532 [Tagetes erecta]|uniref:RNA helicase n=1 Tax=Tagetes erecta TaxID=13708 RepID=A0AAD8KR27_TARER|nr:hypothetical protein QVD17_16527 [Tagetes erecta]KAK1427835.1 hypothetical protein QVD17_16532 [Tagetes erecta]
MRLPHRTVDEADLLFTYGYDKSLIDLKVDIPNRCQCFFMPATSSEDVDSLKKLYLHNPYIFTLPEVGDGKDEIIPKTVQQFWVKSYSERDKLHHILALLKLDLVQKKVLVFTNTITTSYKLKFFLELAIYLVVSLLLLVITVDLMLQILELQRILKVQFYEEKLHIGGKQPSILSLATISLFTSEKVPFSGMELAVVQNLVRESLSNWICRPPAGWANLSSLPVNCLQLAFRLIGKKMQC